MEVITASAIRPGQLMPYADTSPAPQQHDNALLAASLAGDEHAFTTLYRRLEATFAGIAWEVVFVDDNSPDGTWDVVRGLARMDTRVRCIRRIGRRGEGRFERISWEHAIDLLASQLERVKQTYGNSALFVPYGTGSYNQVNGSQVARREIRTMLPKMPRRSRAPIVSRLAVRSPTTRVVAP